jgi:RNA polymerase sigma-70 factor (ECF subfamily)
MTNSDQALIRAVLAGDKEAYGVLVERHGESMFRVAFRITESEAEAQEIVQEAFLRGYRSLAGFDARADFGTWIYRIAVNCALQVLQKRKAEGGVPITEEYDEEHSGLQLSDGGAGPERLLLDREIEHRRHAAMEKMTEDERLATDSCGGHKFESDGSQRGILLARSIPGSPRLNVSRTGTEEIRSQPLDLEFSHHQL